MLMHFLQTYSLLITTEGIEKYLSGIILFDETIRQKSKNQRAFNDILKEKGILIGIKADTGLVNLPFHEGENVTEGLDGLKDRILNYKLRGVTFAKWRALIKINENSPSKASIHSNTHALARFSSICQELGVVPLMEFDVSRSGNHSINDCYDITMKGLKSLFKELNCLNVFIQGTVLKVNMITHGSDIIEMANSRDVGYRTNSCLNQILPNNKFGILFLSGGQSCVEATENLNSIIQNNSNNTIYKSFCFGRAIQKPVLISFSKSDYQTAEKQYIHRLHLNSLASLGHWAPDMEENHNN
jgi:fructose-bisphosphate aldolase, class I